MTVAPDNSYPFGLPQSQTDCYDFEMAPLTASAASNYVQNALMRRATVAETLTPSDEQKTTLYVIGAYVVFITLAWNLWGLRHILYPWKCKWCFRRVQVPS
jgi:hypothetical protein